MPASLPTRRDALKAVLPVTGSLVLPAGLALDTTAAHDRDTVLASGSDSTGTPGSPLPDGARPTVPVLDPDGVTRRVDIVVVGAGMVHAARHGLGKAGVDPRTALQRAIDEARSLNAGIMLPAGDFTLSAGRGLDITGVRSLEGTARLTFTDAPVTGALFSQGRYGEIGSRLRLSRGQYQLTVRPGLSLRTGQTLLFLSGEPTPYAARRYYARGERAQVAEYNASTGALTLMSALLYDYRSSGPRGMSVHFPDTENGRSTANVVFDGATILAVDEHILSLGYGLTIAGPAVQDAAGFIGRMVRIESAASFENFGYLGLGLFGSTGRIEGSIVSGYYARSGDSYGIGVMDLSRVTVSGEIVGGRHAVVSGGGGWLPRSLCHSSLDGVSSGGISLPSVLHIVGGEYRAQLGAIDAHGGVEELIVTGATVHEGVIACARRNRIIGSTLYHTRFAGVYTTGTTFAEGQPYAPEGETWGRLEISDSTIVSVGQATRPAVQVTNGVYEAVVLRDVHIRGRWNTMSRTAQSDGIPEAYQRPLSIGDNAACQIANLDVEARVDIDYEGDVDVIGAAQPLPSRIYASHPTRIRWTGNAALAVFATSRPANDDGAAVGAGVWVDIDAEVRLDLTGYKRMLAGLDIRNGAPRAFPRRVLVRGSIENGPAAGAELTARRVSVDQGDFSNNGLHAARGNQSQRAGVVITAEHAALNRVRCGDDRARVQGRVAQPGTATQTMGVYFSALGPAGSLDLVDVDLTGSSARAQGFEFLNATGARVRTIERSVQGDGRPLPNQWNP